ncbi:MAG: hypothetical protein JRD89_01620 [Deltaproteobacteria bacterium]|nr:hypothetical protein [Deltaproteobacteria bacterium]
MLIVDPNGLPAVSVKDEIELEKMISNVFTILTVQMNAAMQRQKGGALQLDTTPIKDQIKQIYFLGRLHQ